MSDGPHKSLNMSRKWKRFAEGAANAAFSREEVAGRLCEGLGEDWTAEVPARLIAELARALEQPEGTLFGEHALPDLRGLLRDPACKGLARRTVEYAQQALREGKVGPGALEGVVDLAVKDRASSRVAQVEEHYLRYADHAGAGAIRAHAQELVGSDAVAQLAKNICDAGREGPIAAREAKRDGVDDGVLLS